MRASLCRIAIAALAGLCLLTPGRPATAAQFPQPQPQKFEIKGTISGLQPALVRVKADNGELWLVKVDANLKEVKLTGNAEPSWLQQGMFVEFDNRFDARGLPVTAVTELKVFTPNAKTQFGATPLAERSGQPIPQGNPPAIDMRVTGRLLGYKNDKISVMAGDTPVAVTLAPILTISVELNDYRFSRIGDKIHVTGKYFVKGQGVADRIEVTGTGLYEGEKRKKR